MKVNHAKTQLIVHGTKRNLQNVQPVRIKFGSSVIRESRTVKTLGLVMNRYLTFEDHISQVVAKCTGVLISLSHAKHVLPSWNVAHVVNALVVSSVRYCIPVYGTCSKTQLHRVQKLLNLCARVISGRRKYDHVSDVLRKLGWLRAKQLVSYHRLCLVETALLRYSYDTRQTGLLYCPRSKACSGDRRLAHCRYCVQSVLCSYPYPCHSDLRFTSYSPQLKSHVVGGCCCMYKYKYKSAAL